MIKFGKIRLTVWSLDNSDDFSELLGLFSFDHLRFLVCCDEMVWQFTVWFPCIFIIWVAIPFHQILKLKEIDEES